MNELKVDPRIEALVLKMAGDKTDKVTELALQLVQEGKSPSRALADALGILKIVKFETKKDEEEETEEPTAEVTSEVQVEPTSVN